MLRQVSSSKSERAWNLCRAFNVREGLSRKDDSLPGRFAESLRDEPCKGEFISEDVLQRLLDYYYEFRGWDVQTDIPPRKKFEELELGYVADELQRLERL